MFVCLSLSIFVRLKVIATLKKNVIVDTVVFEGFTSIIIYLCLLLFYLSICIFMPASISVFLFHLKLSLCERDLFLI